MLHFVLQSCNVRFEADELEDKCFAKHHGVHEFTSKTKQQLMPLMPILDMSPRSEISQFCTLLRSWFYYLSLDEFVDGNYEWIFYAFIN